MPSAAEKKPAHRNRGWWFLAAMVGLYLLLLPLAPELIQASTARCFALLRTLAPVLAAVMVLLWVINLLVAPEAVRHWLGEGAGWRGWLLAIGGGILSHGPVYAWYPLLTDLQRHGVRPALLAAFLYARSIKLPWLPMLAYYLGTKYMLILTFYLVLFSPAVGLVTERLCGPRWR